MRVKRLKISGLTTHKATEVAFPEAGLVVITGDNGSGKSSIIEAVHVCRWGKSLRGTDLWAGPGAIELDDYDGGSMIRKRTQSGRTSLKVEGHGEFQTAARAKREVGGDPKIWQRSCVFSSEDVLTFTRATDAERKRMLESVLGLSRFDEGHKKARAEVREAEHAFQLADQASQNAQQALLTAKRHCETLLAANDSAKPDGDPEQLACELVEHTASLDELARTVKGHEDSIGDMRERRAALRAELKASQRHRRDHETAVCSACNRPFDDTEPDPAAIARIDEEISGIETQLSEIDSLGRAAVLERDAAAGEMFELEKRATTVRALIDRHERHAEVVEANKARLDRALVDIKRCEDEANARALTRTEAATTASVLIAAEKVLGTKGLRSHVLGGALQGLEAAANYWLERFTPGVTVKISPTRELKSGGTADEISVTFDGVAGGHGYKGSSRGERRRQDVALTWAFGEVEAAASGLAQSTMFCDEPFDALDADGVDALVTAMDEVRRRRCIVVISHSTSLVKALRPDVHYHVSGGEVERRR